MNKNALLAERIKSATAVFTLLTSCANSGTNIGKENLALLADARVFLAVQYQAWSQFPSPDPAATDLAKSAHAE